MLSHHLVRIYSNLLQEGYYENQLNPKFWSPQGIFDRSIREKLLSIAHEFYDNLKLETPIIDIQLTGSLANYTYTDYSDLDVHIIIDFSKINKDVELVKKALDGMRFVWNLRHNITIKEHEVEMYLQDINEVHLASGLYSLMEDKWLKKPVYNPPEIDEKDVDLKFEEFAKEITRLENVLNLTNLTREEAKHLRERAIHIKDKIQNGRKQCLGVGVYNEFCVENLVFKKLRNAGLIAKLIELSSEAYDKIYSESV
jgi:hypothetical protein